MFDRFQLVWICPFPFALGVCWLGEGGGVRSGRGYRFVIVALPGLFSCFFCLKFSFGLYWLVLDSLSLVGSTGVLLLVFFCSSISVVSCCRVLIVVSSR